jgi:hypothetical protein
MVLSPEIELWPAQIAKKTLLKRAYHPIFNRYLFDLNLYFCRTYFIEEKFFVRLKLVPDVQDGG